MAKKATARLPLARVQRRIAIRVIRSYNTISYVAAGLLAKASPIDLLAMRASRIFDRMRGMRAQGATSTVHALRTMAEEEDKKVLAEWKNRLEDPSLPSELTTKGCPGPQDKGVDKPETRLPILSNDASTYGTWVFRALYPSYR